jgi:hypothetical protein
MTVWTLHSRVHQRCRQSLVVALTPGVRPGRGSAVVFSEDRTRGYSASDDSFFSRARRGPRHTWRLFSPNPIVFVGFGPARAIPWQTRPAGRWRSGSAPTRTPPRSACVQRHVRGTLTG